MGYAILAFVACFLLIGSALLLLFYREMLGRRLNSILSSGVEKTPAARERLVGAVGSAAGYFGKFATKKDKDHSGLKRRLGYAGLREEWQMNVYIAVRFLIPAVLLLMIFPTGLFDWNPFLAVVCAFALGYLGPDYWLGYKIKTRQEAIRRALPDVMDLLVVCLEAGLSLDQAVMRTSQEMRAGEEMESEHRVMADELTLVMYDVRGGRTRAEAWKNFAERSDVDAVRVLVGVLVQADQFGTGMSKAMRVQADTMRTRRTQLAERMAAKTSVKLVFPLVFFIFPSLYIVTIGPAVILFIEGFKD
jgi:tight adherence protein C